CRAAGGQPTREGCDKDQCRSDREPDHSYVTRRHFQLGANQFQSHETKWESQQEAEERRSESALEEEPDDLTPSRADRNAHADFATSLANRNAQHRVESNGGKKECNAAAPEACPSNLPKFQASVGVEGGHGPNARQRK